MASGDPTLTFIWHLRAEHRRLNELLHRLEKNWTGVGQPTVVEGLQTLRDELAQHFAQEDEGGFLEEAVCRCPSLSEPSARLEREHPWLLDRLDAIIQHLQDSSASESRQTEQEFQEFAAMLRAHEVAENRILATAFGTDE